MTTEITTVGAVIAICSRCGERSQPTDPDKVESVFGAQHRARHEKEDRRDRMKERGHDMKVTGHWVDGDQSEGQAKCSCGWSLPTRENFGWVRDQADQHLLEAEIALEAAGASN